MSQVPRSSRRVGLSGVKRGASCAALGLLMSLALPISGAGAQTGVTPSTAPATAPAVSTHAAPAAAAEPAKAGDAAEPAEAAAPAAPKPIAITLNIDIDLAAQRLNVKVHGKPLHTWAISSGTREFPTPTGTFRPQWMAKMWFSKKYDDAPMPHSIFFKDGAAIHATNSTGRLGSPASHGCIRLAPANAAALYALVTKHGMVSTRIAVHGTPKWREPQVASRTDRSPAVAPLSRGPSTIRYSAYAYAPTAYVPPPSSGFIYPGDAPRYIQARYAAYGYPPVRNRVINPRFAPYYPRY
jgi:lipoprotein-anchoring transpeptidase ErfK/SrfK